MDGWIFGLLVIWLVGYSVGWILDWLVGYLVGWLDILLVGWIFGWLVFWLVGYSAGRIFCWLVGYFVGCLGSCGNFGCVDDSPRWSWDDEDGPQTRGECRELDLLLNLLPCYHT